MSEFKQEKWSYSALVAACLFMLVCLATICRGQTFSDPGFTADLITSVPSAPTCPSSSCPIGVFWSPDGRMFILQKNGVILIYKNGALLSTPFLDFSSKVNTSSDNGMWGLAFDPNFPTNGYIYLTYVYEPNGNPNDNSPKISRLVRVTANPASNNVMLAGSEITLLDNVPDDDGTHAMGTIRFATDGTMYVGSGDGASPFITDPNAIGAQDITSVRGKIFHLNTDGSAVNYNPFYDGTDSVQSKVWAYGIRNPYRFSLHPVSGDPYIGDLGWDTWEEIDHIVKGGNYGWPCYEGVGPQPLYQAALTQQCASVTSVIPPILTYSHQNGDLGQGGTCIVGGDFYTGTLYPAAYQTNYFYADYSGNWIHRLVLDANGNAVSNATFATGIAIPTCVEQGPDGLLYFVAFGSGEIRRIRYNGPSATATATPTYGYSPLLVSFSSAGSTNSAGGSLLYSWKFGDGTSSTNANPSHTYTTNAVVTYNALLTVTSGTQTSTAPVKITVGSKPPVPTITAPTNNTGYMPGQTVFYQGSATDPDDGTLSASALSWNILLHHNTHIHTGIYTNGAQGSFVAQNHGTIGTFYYEIILTATDSSGLSTSTNVNVQVIADTIPPTAPASLLVTPLTGEQIGNYRLVWNPSTDNAAVAGYQLERQSPPSTNFVVIGSPTVTTYTDSGLAPGTTYGYRVQAVDASGNLSPFSNVATITTPAGISGLVAAYSFNEGSGTTIADASGNGNTGTLEGPTWTTQGKFGNALSFDGASLIAVNDSPSLDLTTGMTVEAWVYPNVAPGDYTTVLMKEQPNEMVYTLYAGAVSSTPNRPSEYIYTTGEQGNIGTAALKLNTWTHLAATYDGSMMRLYTNGNLVASNAVSGTMTNSTSQLSIGGNGIWGEYFQGFIDEIRIYSRALTAAQIQSDMTTAISISTSNTAPTISSISNQNSAMNTPTAAIPFTVDDAGSGPTNLTVSGVSSNLTLVPNANIVFGGSGANRTVTITPAAGQSGTATITVKVSDGSLTTSTTFVLTVTFTDTPPTISSIGNQTVNQATPTAAIPFVVGDAETPAGSLTVSGVSTNLTLVPNGNIVFGGSGSNRTVTVTPVANQTGKTLITVTVSDGTLSTNTSFVVTVTPDNPPTISSIGNQMINENTSTGPIGFTVGDVETPAGSLTVSGVSTNLTLVPNGNIVFGGSGSNRTVTVSPVANQTGTTLITVTVGDGTLSTNTSFVVTVTPDNPPTISSIGNQVLTENASTGPIGFTVGDVDSPAGSLTVSGVSSNLTLVPNSNLAFGGSGSNRTVTVMSANGQTGTTLVTVSVSDGQLSANSAFTVTVNPPPVLLPFAITSITLSGTSDVNLVWNGRQGTNIVQFSPGDGNGQYTSNFLDLASNILSGAGVTNYIDTGGATNIPSHYYRIRLIQP
jgi:glucose/arabinose dehydrogenase